jgi:tetratricopeptide (TPR) repeat protein
MTTDTQKHYAAFISYAHADEAMAARLHKALETYPVPKALRAQGKTTKPVFRDVAELTAAHSLSEKIRDAVQDSRVLIVLCSPAAKASHWVNEEIRLFRDLHGDAAILSAIIDGTPETAFPKALVEGGREPLAAALGSEKSGFKLGVTQLAAGILGTGLDDLIQRGAKRRNRLMGAGIAASLALSGVMGFTAWQAVEARNDAQTARGEAEGLVEYMIKDLKFKLEPVGRLDLLQGIGDKAVEYYDKQDIKSLNDDSLNRQAAARQVLAQVHLDAGRMNEAQAEIEAAADLTREVLERNPDDTDAIFAHAQSEFWVGEYYRRQGKLAEMEKPWREYDRLAQVLYKTDPTNFDWVMEAAYGKNNLGFRAQNLVQQEFAGLASENYEKAISYYQEAIELNPESKVALTGLSDAMDGKASMLLAFASKKHTQDFMEKNIKYSKDLTLKYPNDINLRRTLYLTKTDYYNGYFIRLDSTSKPELTKALNELKAVIQHDPENLKSVFFFIQAVSNTYENFDLTELVLRKKQVDDLLRKLPEQHTLNTGYYHSMSDIFEIKINILNGESEAAKPVLKTLSDNYLNQDTYSPDDWKIIYNLFRLNVDLGQIDTSQKYAKLFLKTVSERSNLEFPTILYKKLTAELILENCEAVKPLANKLEARGYLDGLDLDLNPCRSF